MMYRLYCILINFLLCASLSGAVLEVGQNKAYVTLNLAISQARGGDTLLVYPGTYREGSIVVDKPLIIIGKDQPVLDGENSYGLLRLESDSVVIRGLTLKDVGVSYVEDLAAIRIVRSKYCVIESNSLINAFFGIYLERSTDCIMRNNHVLGYAEHEMNSGNAIHLCYSSRNLLEGNPAEGHRDGIYLEFVDNSTVQNNLV